MKVIEKSLNTQATLQYSETQWDEDSFRLFGERMDPEACPKCGRTGFFGPRAADPGVKFRCCRYCGFNQVIGEEPVQMLPVVHKCADWPVCAKAPYVWWVHPEDRKFTCPFCGRDSDIHGRNVFAPSLLVDSPSESENHPWRKVPQNQSYAYYLRFWENWDFTKGRVVL